MLLEELKKQKNKILKLAQQYGAKNIRVFGSVARGEENENSDIDFLVDFPEGYDLFKQRLELAEQLELLTKHPVDLIPEIELHPFIKEQILNEAVNL